MKWWDPVGRLAAWCARLLPGGRLCAPSLLNTSAAGATGAPAQRQGAHWERHARRYLEQRGLTLLKANFRCPGGEIDLIMREGRTVVFVEVRQRASPSHGGAAASVTVHKQRRLLRAAHAWLQRYPVPPPCRIDVVAIDGEHGERVTWLRDAVQAPH